MLDSKDYILDKGEQTLMTDRITNQKTNSLFQSQLAMMKFYCSDSYYIWVGFPMTAICPLKGHQAKPDGLGLFYQQFLENHGYGT